jgi:hypothetical protein
MTIKVKLFDKKTQFEIDDISVMQNLVSKIKEIISKDYQQYDYRIKIYGEIIPFRK